MSLFTHGSLFCTFFFYKHKNTLHILQCLHLLFAVIPRRGMGAAPLSPHRTVAWSPRSTEQGLWVVKQGSLAL